MAKQVVVTIGRQFGSGGHEIGNLLAERLDIPLYDNNLVRMAAERLGIREATVQTVDETTLNSFLTGYVLAPLDYSSSFQAVECTQPLNEQVYDLQCEIIRKLAAKGSCVMVGRCADYVLKDQTECLNVFIYAEKEDRIKRIAQRYDLSERKAADKIKRIDRERKSYYEFHTGSDWGSIGAHQILLNVSKLGVEGTVDVLEAICRRKMKE